MAPKPISAARTQHARKPSTTGDTSHTSTISKEKGKTKEMEKGTERDKSKKDLKDTMLPPPPPLRPLAILEPELEALTDSLKNTTITAAQIFKFYAETKRLGIQRHAPCPPRSMTSVLEFELARYDQICDALESQLTRAISVLQRDLSQEENRIREEEAEKARAKALEASKVDADIEMANVPESSSETGAKSQQVIPSGTTAGTGKVPLRRPSKISLSTLRRNPFPLKLDLSSASLRLGTDESGLSALSNLTGLGTLGAMGVGDMTGLASPVTLAPKSARPMAPGELPPDVLAALASASAVGNQNMTMPDPNSHVDIDLTLDDDLRVPTGMEMINAGSSVDKPIELDLDLDVHMSELASDIFGDQTGDGVQQSGGSTSANVNDLFGAPTSGAQSETEVNVPTSSMDVNMLLSGNQGSDDALFASLNDQNSGNNEATQLAQPGSDGTGTGGTGDGAAFDLSLFFDSDTSNQEQIDMMEQFLKMDNAGAAVDASETGTNNNNNTALQATPGS